MNQDNQSKTKQTVNNLLQFIRDEHLQPGQRLPNEYELAEQLHVGRGTIREAIRELVSRNVLDVRQGAGTFISFKDGIPEDPLGLSFTDITDDMVFDMLEVRLLLESGNSIIRKLMPIVASSVQLNIGFTRDKFRLRTIEEHREIVHAIAHHDVRGAKYAMYAHLNTSRSSMLVAGQLHQPK